ncbi:MAG: hypothetical protein RMI85_00825 [Candidatus Korarchaeum sp.]|nr:hypothetical protein [Candidatus Korarchaeum sp.]
MSFPSDNSEKVLGVLLLRKPKSLGRYDTFAAVLTTERMIFAQVTSIMLKEAIEKAKREAKAEGKGFLEQWTAQLRASLSYVNKYLLMKPSQILAETPGNFDIKNDEIGRIKLRLSKWENVNEFEVEVHSPSGKLNFRMDENVDNVKLLKQVYGDRVKLPLGYSISGLKLG